VAGGGSGTFGHRVANRCTSTATSANVHHGDFRRFRHEASVWAEVAANTGSQRSGPTASMTEFALPM
jgi:hypothetical protein